MFNLFFNFQEKIRNYTFVLNKRVDICSEKKKRVWESVRQPCDQPSRGTRLRTILCGTTHPKMGETNNHALITRSWIIHQTWYPVSLELKDTEVRAYRTDPVQVRSCYVNSTSGIIKHALCLWTFDVGYYSHWIPTLTLWFLNLIRLKLSL